MRKVVAVIAAIVVVCGSIAAFADSFNETLRKAQRGNADAQTELGIMYAENGNYSDAARWFTKAAEQGHSMTRWRTHRRKMKNTMTLPNTAEAVRPAQVRERAINAWGIKLKDVPDVKAGEEVCREAAIVMAKRQKSFG